jgi:hypothetical protein
MPPRMLNCPGSYTNSTRVKPVSSSHSCNVSIGSSSLRLIARVFFCITSFATTSGTKASGYVTITSELSC